MDKIYLVRGTDRVGPFTQAEIQAQVASGALNGSSLVWWEGLAEWTPLSRTPLAAATGAVPTPAAGMPATPTQPATPGFAPAPMPALQAGVPVTAPVIPAISALAIVSLVTGILAIPLIFCYGFGVVLGIAAVITGHIARSQTKRNPTQGGEGLALAGLICGYVSIGLFFVFVVAVSVLIALGNQVKSVFSTISTQLNQASPNP